MRRYVPELEDVPDEYLAEPWRMPDDVQRELSVIGRDYPGPIVDHREARERALARYRAAVGVSAPVHGGPVDGPRLRPATAAGARADTSRL